MMSRFFDFRKSTRLTTANAEWQKRLQTPELYFSYFQIQFVCNEQRTNTLKYLIAHAKEKPEHPTTVLHSFGIGLKTNQFYADLVNKNLDTFCYDYSKNGATFSIKRNICCVFELLEKLFPLYTHYENSSREVRGYVDALFLNLIGFNAWDLTAEQLKSLREELLKSLHTTDTKEMKIHRG